MRRWLTLLTLFTIFNLMDAALATDGHQGHTDNSASHSTNVNANATTDTLTHQEVVEGVRAEFQVMSLAAMNMKDPEGKSHHIMAKFFDASTEKQINNAIGKIKVISPSGKEQVESLQNYSGILAANFDFDENGKYGVICLFKVDDKKRLVKFWYQHE